MTAKKYVNLIIKRVKCSGNKRKEIRRQLLSDISAALESGETLENVISRMGNVYDVAKEFNQNLSEKELSTYKRNRRIKIITSITIIVLLLAYMAYWSLPKSKEMGSSGVFEEKSVEEQVKQVIQELDNNDFTALRERGTDAMQKVLTQKQIDSARKKVYDEEWGDFQSFGKVYMSEVKQIGELYAVVQMTAVYENIGVTYTISFDKDMKLAGLYMK